MSLALGGWWSPNDLRLVTDDKGLRLFAAQKIRWQFCHGIAKPHKAGGPILTSVVGQNRKSSVGLGMSGVGGKAEVEFGRLEVCF